MSARKKNNQNGMTYAEVAVCLFVVAIVITPLCASLVSSTKTRVESESISTSTLNAEALMEDIKTQLTKDIELQNRREGNRLSDTDPTTEFELDKHTNYLTSTPSAATPIDIKEYLDFTTPEERDRHDTKYNTDQYDYEVAIWDVKGISLTGTSTMKLNKDTLPNTAIKLYSNADPTLRFDSSLETADLVEFKINAGMAKAFEGKTFMDTFVPSDFVIAPSTYEISDFKIVSFEKDSSSPNGIKPLVVPYDSSKDNIEIVRSTINEGNDGYIYTIADKRYTSPTPFIDNIRGIVVLDLSQLIRDFAFTTDPNHTHTFKFVNKTPYTIVIKVLRNVKDDGIETISSIDTEISKKFNIVTEEGSTGKTVIERIQDTDLQNNYLIAMVVRDKSPRLGKPGKIVKKMVDVYSYTPNK